MEDEVDRQISFGKAGSRDRDHHRRGLPARVADRRVRRRHGSGRVAGRHTVIGRVECQAVEADLRAVRIATGEEPPTKK